MYVWTVSNINRLSQVIGLLSFDSGGRRGQENFLRPFTPLFRFQKLMFECLIGSDPVLEVDGEHLLEKVSCCGIEFIVKGVFEVIIEFAVVAVDLLVVAAFEEIAVGEQDVQDHASGEDVAGNVDWLAALHVDDFGGNVSGGSAAVEQIGGVLAEGRQSEIYQNDIPASIAKHDVVKFDVPMHDFKASQIVKCGDYSAHDEFGLLQREAFLLVESFDESAALQEFSDYVECGVGFEDALDF